MKTIYLWFYCLPLWKAALFVILITLILIYIFNRYKTKKYVRSITALLAVASVVIVLNTTLNRDMYSLDYTVTLVPFKSYIDVLNGANKELIRANFMNVLLFYPLGLFTGLLTEKSYKKALWFIFFCSISIFIEFMQFKYNLGYAEIDDVIHNSLGALIGILTSGIRLSKIDIEKLFRRHKYDSN